MTINEIQWGWMRICENQYKSMIMNGNKWNQVRLMEIAENLCTLLRLNGVQWNQWQLHEN